MHPTGYPIIWVIQLIPDRLTTTPLCVVSGLNQLTVLNNIYRHKLDVKRSSTSPNNPTIAAADCRPEAREKQSFALSTACRSIVFMNHGKKTKIRCFSSVSSSTVNHRHSRSGGTRLGSDGDADLHHPLLGVQSLWLTF